MKVTTISASIKYSHPSNGGWKTVELGAEAQVNGHEGWKKAQARLYKELSDELKGLWANGNGVK